MDITASSILSEPGLSYPDHCRITGPGKITYVTYFRLFTKKE